MEFDEFAAPQEPDLGVRMASMFIDHLIMCIVIGILSVPVMIASFLSIFDVDNELDPLPFLEQPNYYLLGIFALYFFKDSFKGRSIAKGIFKLQVVEHSTGKVASPLRCVVRNLFCVIWPIEVLVTLINGNRRIGDMVAGTKVVKYVAQMNPERPNYGQIGLSYLMAFVFMVILMQPITAFQSRISKYRISYMEDSINIVESEQLEQVFTDSLGHLLTPDIRIYDKIRGEEDMKYVFIGLKLKEDLLEYDRDFEELKRQVEPIIYSHLKRGTFRGRIKYSYSTRRSSRFHTEYF